MESFLLKLLRKQDMLHSVMPFPSLPSARKPMTVFLIPHPGKRWGAFPTVYCYSGGFSWFVFLLRHHQEIRRSGDPWRRKSWAEIVKFVLLYMWMWTLSGCRLTVLLLLVSFLTLLLLPLTPTHGIPTYTRTHISFIFKSFYFWNGRTLPEHHTIRLINLLHDNNRHPSREAVIQTGKTSPQAGLAQIRMKIGEAPTGEGGTSSCLNNPRNFCVFSAPYQNKYPPAYQYFFHPHTNVKEDSKFAPKYACQVLTLTSLYHHE